MIKYVCGIVAVLGLASVASAQGGPGWGFGWYGPPYRYYQQETIPYFSLHPPVYYSHVVPRTYGYSPFAYPPGTMTPDVVEETSATIQNPHVKPEEVSPGKSTQTPKAKNSSHTDKTAVIINPFAVPTVQVAAE